jgi:hypothetical protein
MSDQRLQTQPLYGLPRGQKAELEAQGFFRVNDEDLASIDGYKKIGWEIKVDGLGRTWVRPCEEAGPSVVDAQRETYARATEVFRTLGFRFFGYYNEDLVRRLSSAGMSVVKFDPEINGYRAEVWAKAKKIGGF